MSSGTDWVYELFIRTGLCLVSRYTGSYSGAILIWNNKNVLLDLQDNRNVLFDLLDNRNVMFDL